MLKIKKKSQSKFFNFNLLSNNKKFKITYYDGWHKLFIYRIDFLKSSKDKFFFDINKINSTDHEEKIIILSKGSINIKEKNLNKKLKKFDCIHTNKSLKKFELEYKKGSQLFIVLGEKKLKTKKKLTSFNLEKNLKKIDLWGGKCISRVFNGQSITIVLFKLKKGFKFHDTGHKNEQITWLIKGKMKFYVKNKSANLKANKASVDIGSYDYHGGTSFGAMGFDAFSPKRSEKRYS